MSREGQFDVIIIGTGAGGGTLPTDYSSNFRPKHVLLPPRSSKPARWAKAPPTKSTADLRRVLQGF